MPLYKRNQLETAISSVLARSSREPKSEFLSRLKRLLETDRAFGRASRANDPQRSSYAFHSYDPPGSGNEIWYSEYEVFALLVGIQLMEHGWPQSFAVSVLRRLRPDLEKHHARILKQDAQKLFDQDALRRNAKPGDFAFNNTDPVLLTIVMKPRIARSELNEPYKCEICRGAEESLRFIGEAGGGGAMFELVGLAHALSAALKPTEPQRRGRS